MKMGKPKLDTGIVIDSVELATKKRPSVYQRDKIKSVCLSPHIPGRRNIKTFKLDEHNKS
jgi:hypothetical protein